MPKSAVSSNNEGRSPADRALLGALLILTVLLAPIATAAALRIATE